MFLKNDYSLRKIEHTDRINLLSWRNHAHVREVMYTDHEITAEEHDAWFHRALNDPHACHLIFDRAGIPQAFTSFTSIDQKHGTCNWGYYLISPHPVRGAGSVMAWFSLDWCFRVLSMKKLLCESFAFNHKALSLYRKFGFTQDPLFRKRVKKNGLHQDVIGFSLLSDEWNRLMESLAMKLFVRGSLID